MSSVKPHLTENCIFFFYFLPHTEALKAVVEAAMAGVSVLSLCEKGDAYIVAETAKIFKKEKDMKKGRYFVALCPSVSRAFSSVLVKASGPST